MRTVSSQCRNMLMGQQQQQARKALRDDACTELSPVKIWRKNASFLQSSYKYKCSVDRQFYRQQSISAGVEQTAGKVKDSFHHSTGSLPAYSLHVQGKWALGMERLQLPVTTLLLCIMLSLGWVISLCLQTVLLLFWASLSDLCSKQ